MTNYTVDASVYALPKTSGNGDADKKIESDYIERLKTIRVLVMRRDINIFLLLQDIKLLHHLNLVPEKDSIKSLKVQNEAYHSNEVIAWFKEYLLDPMQSYNLGKTGKVEGFAEYNAHRVKVEEKVFENRFHFRAELDKDAENSIVPAEVKDVVENEELRDNFVKNALIIAKLNEYVYKNNPDRHKIILNTSPGEIEIKNTAIKKIIMDPVKDENGAIIYPIRHYNIFPSPLENVKISNGLVKIADLSTIETGQKNPGPFDIYSAYEKAKQEFGDTLIFGKDVEDSIVEYQNKIRKKMEENPGWKELKEETENLSQALSSYLKTLHDVSLDPGFYQWSSSENYCCFPCCSLIHEYKSLSRLKAVNCSDCRPPCCPLIHECKSLISLMGANCSDEYQNQMQNSQAKQERQFDDGSGNKEVFTLHLRPLSKKCYGALWFLTLRIYFKVKGRKIVIGWIGQHPYLPSCPSVQRGIACQRIECQNNPAHVPGTGI
ncbi:MAG: hypothetical protein LBK08_10460 [Treponema sp.]|jgi:hypothetical protein|nr:hypothetical protein [Treponema sp.]